MYEFTTPRRVGVFILFLFTLIAFDALGWLAGLKRPLATVLHSAAAPLYSAGESIDAAVDGPDLDPKLLACMERTEELIIENIKLKALAVENEELKTALGYRNGNSETLLLARVISESTDGMSSELLLDRGSDDGVVIERPVIAGNSVIIGKISAVSVGTARVRLLLDSNSTLAVTINDSAETLGLLEGNGGLSMSIDFIPQNESVSPGDVVVTSGAESGIRRGLVVGTIEKVNKSTQDPFQSASVASFRSFRHPVFVQVLLSGEHDDSSDYSMPL